MAGRLARYRELLADRTFAAFFASFILGEAGYAVYAVGVLWLALTVSGSPLIAGIVLAVEFGIYALSFAAGPIVDRARDLRTILLVGYPIQGVLAVVLGALALTDRLTVPILLVLIIALSVVWDFTWTALNAIPPRVVPTDRLFLANGLLGAAAGGNQLAGFAGGAALILVIGSPGAAMLLYGALNFAAAVLALPVRTPSPERAPTRFLDEMVEGWRHLLRTRDPPLLSLTAFSALEGFFSASAQLIITVLAYATFAEPSRSYALLFTAFAIGMVVGSIALGEIAPRRRVGTTLLVTTASEGLLIVVAIAAAPSIWWSVPAWIAVGFASVAFYDTLLVFLQATTPRPLLGRTLTNVYFFRGGARAIGALVIGALLTVLAPGIIGLLLLACYLGMAVVVPTALPGIRRLRF